MPRLTQYHGRLWIQVPQCIDLEGVDTVERPAHQSKIHFTPNVNGSPSDFVARLGLGQAEDLDNVLARRFAERFLPPSCQYSVECEQVQAWQKEREDLEGWQRISIPTEKASVEERQAVIAAALDQIRRERTQKAKELLESMPKGADPQKWSTYAVGELAPMDRTLASLKTLEAGLKLVGDPDNSARDSALEAAQLATDRLAILNQKIDQFWREKYRMFESELREDLGLPPIKIDRRVKAERR